MIAIDETTVSTKIRILCCDGGGMRGLLTILLLEALEQELDLLRPGTKVRDVFHVFAGTSTGSLIACGLSQGLTLDKLKDLFEKQGTKIFETFGLRFYLQTLLRSLTKLRLSLPLFSPAGLESVLRAEDVFPDHLLFGELPKPVLVVSYDCFNRKGVVFKSAAASKKSAQLPVWQVCRSSSAAPVAFPAFLLNDTVFLQNHRSSQRLEGDLDRSKTPVMIPMIDGGMLANNPCALRHRRGVARESRRWARESTSGFLRYRSIRRSHYSQAGHALGRIGLVIALQGDSCLSSLRRWLGRFERLHLQGATQGELLPLSTSY